MTKHACPCCGRRTLTGKGDYEICPVCFWEDDPVQRRDPDYAGGANTLSLNDSRANYERFGAVEERFVGGVRPPKAGE